MPIRARVLAALDALLGDPEPIADPAPPVAPAGPRGDDVSLDVTGQGVDGQDRMRLAVPASTQFLSDALIDRLHASGGIGRRLVQMPAYEATRAWCSVESGDEIDLAEDVDGQLKPWRAFGEALALARKDRGAWILMVPTSGELSEPLEGDGPHEVARLQVFGRREVTPRAWVDDLADERFGRPEVLTVSTERQGIAGFFGDVHASRMLYIPGLYRDPTSPNAADRDYDYCVGDVYWPYLRRLELAHMSSAVLLNEASIPVVTLQDAREKQAADTWSGFVRAFKAARRAMSSTGVWMLGPGDTIQRLNAPLSGLSQAMEPHYVAIASVEGWPLTKLLGTPPGGLTTDDESATKSHQEAVSRVQSEALQQAVERLYDVTLGPDPGRRIEWRPVTAESAETRAAVSLTLAQRDAALIAAGVITAEESRARVAQPVEGHAIPIEDLELDEPTPDEVAAFAAEQAAAMLREEQAAQAPTDDAPPEGDDPDDADDEG